MKKEAKATVFFAHFESSKMKAYRMEDRLLKFTIGYWSKEGD